MENSYGVPENSTHFRGLERYEGDHFYVMDHRQPLAVAITAAMRSAAA
ncbi:hypothetical protein [Actinomadura harenae]|nr:hypothetical protein [Actinomadura harenae]